MAESLRQFLERVLASDLLEPELVELAPRGATEAEFADAPPLPAELRDLLAWHNGFELDVIRLHGIGDAEPRVRQFESGAVEFASDPAGFTFLLRSDGAVISTDHDGGDEQIVARSVDDFLRNYIFGQRAAVFAGETWARAVRAAIAP